MGNILHDGFILLLVQLIINKASCLGPSWYTKRKPIVLDVDSESTINVVNGSQWNIPTIHMKT